MRRDSVWFRYVVDVLVLVTALVMVTLSQGRRAVEFLLPGESGATPPPASAPDPEGRRLLESLPYHKPRQQFG